MMPAKPAIRAAIVPPAICSSVRCRASPCSGEFVRKVRQSGRGSDLFNLFKVYQNSINHGKADKLASMRPHDNPYTPNAGARPPALVGRDDLLESFEVLLERLRRGHSEQSMLITGLRGVGKTVLLDELRGAGARTGLDHGGGRDHQGPDFGERMGQLVRRALFQLAPKARWKERARRAAAVLKSFQMTLSSDGTLSAGLDVRRRKGLPTAAGSTRI